MAYTATALPSAGVGSTFTIPIFYGAFTADVSVGPTVTVPYKCRILGLNGQVCNIAGTTVFTDVDLVLKNVTQSVTIATIAAVNGSTRVSGGATSTPTTNNTLAANDVLEMEIDITGGSSPTATGCFVLIHCIRE